MTAAERPAAGTYADRKQAARDRLTALLNPQTATESRYLVWLLGFDVETIETIATMVERRAT